MKKLLMTFAAVMTAATVQMAQAAGSYPFDSRVSYIVW